MMQKAAIRAASSYEALDDTLSELIASEEEAAFLLSQNEPLRDAYRLALPSLCAARRRLLLLLNAMSQTQAVIGGDDTETHVKA